MLHVHFLMTLSVNPDRSYLQVQTLWLALILRLEHPIPRRSEVRHLHSHPALSQCHQTRLGADSLDISTRQVILLIYELFEVDILVERHLGCMQCEDLALGVLVGILEKNFAIDTAGSNQRWIKGINFVGGHDDFDVSAIIETVQLVEEFQHCALNFLLAS